MTDQPPDWAIKVPSTPDIHLDPTATAATDAQQFPNICAMLLSGSPFLGSLVNLGSGSTGGVPGSMIGGGQNMANTLCGFATGSPSTDATADSLLSGATDVNDSMNANPFAMGIIGMGQDSGGGNSSLAMDGIVGGLGFLGTLFSLLGGCGCSGTYDPTSVTPDDLLSGASDINDAVTGSPMAMGILGLGQGSGGGSGNAILDGFAGGCTFWGQMCGMATGNTDISDATPDSVLDTAGTYLSMGNDLLGTNAGNGADLADWGDGYFGDFMGLMGNPTGLGSGSASMSIPVDNVAGLLGPSTIGGTAQAMVDGVYQGLTNTADVGVSLASMTNSMSQLARDVAYLKGDLVAAGAHAPEVTHYGIVGSHTYDIPAWADWLDVVVLGGGGGGAGCGFLWGEGGTGGSWADATALEVGVDVTGTTLSITVGDGGNGGVTVASDGDASSASGTGWAGISGAGGAGGDAANLDYTGKSPGNHTVDDVIYHGGLTQSGYYSSPGNAPGGGGAGGTIVYMTGGHGAPGAVWVLAYETPGSGS